MVDSSATRPRRLAVAMYTKYALVLLTLAISGARKAAPRLGCRHTTRRSILTKFPLRSSADPMKNFGRNHRARHGPLFVCSNLPQ